MTAPDLEEMLGRALAGVRSDVVAAYPFGSRARGTAREDSDVDVAILAQAGWLQRAQSDLLRRMVGFRNVLVHRYAVISH